jgi:hypothetical protein
MRKKPLVGYLLRGGGGEREAAGYLFGARKAAALNDGWLRGSDAK